jgi:hypothetical protein
VAMSRQLTLKCASNSDKTSTENNGQIYCLKNHAILWLANSIKAGWLQQFVIRREKYSCKNSIFEEAREVNY